MTQKSVRKRVKSLYERPLISRYLYERFNRFKLNNLNIHQYESKKAAQNQAAISLSSIYRVIPLVHPSKFPPGIFAGDQENIS